MSTLSKKLFISVLTLVLTVGAFAATTFAWFTLGNTARISAFEADVQSGAGLEVSYGNSGEWYNAISSKQMNAYLLGDANVSTILSAVSSEDGISFNKFNEDGQGVSGTTDGYIEFTLKFRSLKTGGASIAWDSVVLGGDPVHFGSDIVFRRPRGTATSLNESITAYASHAARVSVTEQTYANNESVADVGRTLVYELAPTEVNTGDVESNIVTGEDGDIQVDGAHDYYARKGNPIFSFTYNNEGTGEPLGITFPGVTLARTVHTLPGTELLKLKKNAGQDDEDDYFYGEFVVRVWLEGWDANTYNVLFDAPLSVSLSFKILD